MQIDAREEIWPLKEVFRISRGSRTETRVVVVTAADGQHIGRGEGVPIRRYNQSPESALAQIEAVKGENNLDRDKLQQLLPPGAARNALDCALWDLEAKISGKRVWELTNISIVPEVETSFTISLDTPDKMGASAAAFVRQAERKHDAKTKEGRSPDRPRQLGSRRSLMTFGVPKILKLKLG